MNLPPAPTAAGSLFRTLLCSLMLPLTCGMARNYQNFDVAVYLPAGVVRRLADPAVLQREWEAISRQVKVDKVYLESERDRLMADEQTLEALKKFFTDRGVRVAGGITYSDNNSGQFRSFCYTTPADREFIQRVAELTARHFDEIILDDFFFVTTKYDSDIAAKGSRSWTQFRLELMNEAAENLILKPARAVNPRVKIIIKFPNWYEHFQGLGFDLDQESRRFDGIYTGTETRDPGMTDQFLQQYESYQILRYFENVAPGRNGGGWIDTFSIRYLDRYAEQLWDTLFAKPREITLFNWAALLQPIQPGERPWQSLPTSFDYFKILPPPWSEAAKDAPPPTMARVAGASLEQVDAFLGQLGRPIGIQSYKPHHSTGEDFLHNYLGMLGIPIDLHPTFPAGADIVLLTESAKFDPDLVAKIKGQLEAGKSVIITSGLLHALQGKGIEDIVELEYTDHKVLAQDYSTGFGSGNRTAVGEESGGRGILFPQIRFLTNDAWALVSARESGNGYPLLIMDRYARGVLYVWTIPDNFRNLYFLPPEVTSAIKNVVMHGFFVRLDGPSQVALFAYDNHTFIVQSYLDHEADVTVAVAGGLTKLRNLVTGEELTGQAPPANPWMRRPGEQEARTTFHLHLLPHSYCVFAAEK
jgi:hypothetical protein